MEKCIGEPVITSNRSGFLLRFHLFLQLAHFALLSLPWSNFPSRLLLGQGSVVGRVVKVVRHLTDWILIVLARGTN